VGRMTDPERFRVGWIVAAAGSGKSRLLAHVADAYPGPVVWCGIPDPAPRTEEALVGWLRDTALQAGAIGPSGAATAEIQTDVETIDAIAELLRSPGPAVLFVIDDAHRIEGTAAEEALGRLVTRTPPRLRLAMASRINLNFDLSRLRVSGQVVEIGPEELRFRTWEV
jgi:ATP/maltotriose-dependent transcriptional regulator MalT